MPRHNPPGGGQPHGRPHHNATKTPSFKIFLRRITTTAAVHKERVLEVACGDLQVPLTKLIPAPNGFSAVCDKQANIDKLLTDDARAKLAAINLAPVMPPELLAKRTLLVRQVDDSVGSRSDSDILAEINRAQPWARISQVIKLPGKTRMFKVRCHDTSAAGKILTEGLGIFNMRVSPGQICKEEFAQLKICLKCYEYETHTKKDCKSTVTICSECSQQGHIFKDCPGTLKKCINCTKKNLPGTHGTMASKCPVRKEVMRAKIQRANASLAANSSTLPARAADSTQSYAAIARETAKLIRKDIPTPRNTPLLPTPAPSPKEILIPRELKDLKMVALIIEAHITAVVEGRPSGEILRENFLRNYDIEIDFADRNSSKFLEHFNMGNLFPSIPVPPANQAPLLPPPSLSPIPGPSGLSSTNTNATKRQRDNSGDEQTSPIFPSKKKGPNGPAKMKKSNPIPPLATTPEKSISATLSPNSPPPLRRTKSVSSRYSPPTPVTTKSIKNTPSPQNPFSQFMIYTRHHDNPPESWSGKELMNGIKSKFFKFQKKNIKQDPQLEKADTRRAITDMTTYLRNTPPDKTILYRSQVYFVDPAKLQESTCLIHNSFIRDVVNKST